MTALEDELMERADLTVCVSAHRVKMLQERHPNPASRRSKSSPIRGSPPWEYHASSSRQDNIVRQRAPGREESNPDPRRRRTRRVPRRLLVSRKNPRAFFYVREEGDLCLGMLQSGSLDAPTPYTIPSRRPAQ